MATQTAERKRPSSARLSRESPLALAAAAGANGVGGARERAGSVQLPATRRVVKAESVAGTAGVARRFYKEDPGLKDLDRREEEFRKVQETGHIFPAHVVVLLEKVKYTYCGGQRSEYSSRAASNSYTAKTDCILALVISASQFWALPSLRFGLGLVLFASQ